MWLIAKPFFCFLEADPVWEIYILAVGSEKLVRIKARWLPKITCFLFLSFSLSFCWHPVCAHRNSTFQVQRSDFYPYRVNTEREKMKGLPYNEPHHLHRFSSPLRWDVFAKYGFLAGCLINCLVFLYFSANDHHQKSPPLFRAHNLPRDLIVFITAS